jgi:hypothetical protein
VIELYCHWFVREGVHLFVLKKRVSTWLDILKVRSAEYGRLKTWIRYMKPSAFIKIWCFVANVSKRSRGTTFNIILLRKPSKSFEWVDVNKPDWCLQQRGKTALTANTATAFLEDFFGYRTARLRLWSPRSKTSRHLNSFYEDFLTKESTAKTHKACSSLNVALNGLLPTLTNKLCYKLQETLWKGWRLFFKKSAEIFSIWYNYTFQLVYQIVYHILSIF